MPSYVIVGASRGLGYQWLKTLSEDPSNVIIGLVRNVETTQEKVSKDKLANVHVLHGDVTDPASLAAAAQQTSQIAGGVVDHLIVNAGYQSAESYMKTPPDFVGKEDLFLKELDNYMHANVAGALFTINAFLPLVKQSEVKKVVVITTGHADEHAMRVWGPGMANAVPYCLSKVALNYLSLLYAVTLKDEGVIFLALSPGCVLTMAERLEDAPKEIQMIYEGVKEPFRKLKPDWDGPVSPKESVEAQLQVVKNLTIEDSGSFLSHNGDKNWL